MAEALHRLAIVKIAASLFLIACVPGSIFAAQIAARAAEIRYGRNVDSGAYIDVLAYIHILPSAVLFSVASVAEVQGWRNRSGLGWVAVGFLYYPVAAILLFAVISIFLPAI